MAMLEVKDINVYYGAIHAIKGISLAVEEGGNMTLHPAVALNRFNVGKSDTAPESLKNLWR